MKNFMRLLLLAICTLLFTIDLLAQVNDDPRAVLSSIIKEVKRTSCKAQKLQWDTIEATMYAKAQNAKTTADLKESLEFLLSNLDDRSASFYDPTSKTIIANHASQSHPSTAVAKSEGSFEFKILHDDVRYLKLSLPSGEFDPQQHAELIRTAVDSLKKEQGLHWIIDLRNVSGTNPASLLAGIGPLVGEGLVAGTIDQKEKIKKLFEVHNGKFYDDQHLVIGLKSAVELKAAKVAVLINENTSGAGEFVAIALKGRKHTRFFGQNTSGSLAVTTSIQITPQLAMTLTEGYYQDRKGNVYPNGVKPESVFVAEASRNNKDGVIEEAKHWLTKDHSQNAVAPLAVNN
jgi:carboxyl-terminal processing protease